VNSFRKTLGLLLLVAGLLGPAVATCLGQSAEVTHNANLRSDPSTDNPPIRLLTPPEQVELLEANKTGGYYHVQTSLGEQGWLWSHNVKILAPTPTPTRTPTPTPAPGVTATPTPSPGITTATVTPTPTVVGVATAIDPTWDKPAPVEITFHTASGTCSPDGDPTGDTETYHLKNRIDIPPNGYHEVTFTAVTALQVPHVHTTRKAWTPSDRALAATLIVPFEGVPLSVAGFLVNDSLNQVKVETAEKTNCGFTQAAEVDWHVPLVGAIGQHEKNSVVVEVTPRIRKDHPKWTTARLNPLVNTSAQVRISGWLMFDPDHPSHIGVFRTTLWEIHPITKIEVLQSGAWVDLESLP